MPQASTFVRTLPVPGSGIGRVGLSQATSSKKNPCAAGKEGEIWQT
jgi:hypothetical protein